MMIDLTPWLVLFFISGMSALCPCSARASLRCCGRQGGAVPIRDDGSRYTTCVPAGRPHLLLGSGGDVPHRAALVAGMGELRFMETWGWMMRAFLYPQGCFLLYSYRGEKRIQEQGFM